MPKRIGTENGLAPKRDDAEKRLYQKGPALKRTSTEEGLVSIRGCNEKGLYQMTLTKSAL